MDSQYIFKDENIKSRLLQTQDDWYVAESKKIDSSDQWKPWICGTADFLKLTEQDKRWSIIAERSNG